MIGGERDSKEECTGRGKRARCSSMIHTHINMHISGGNNKQKRTTNLSLSTHCKKRGRGSKINKEKTHPLFDRRKYMNECVCVCVCVCESIE